MHHINLKKVLRQVERKRLGIHDHESDEDSDGDDEILDDEVTLANRKKVVSQKPPHVRTIIRNWIKKARNNLKNKKAGKKGGNDD